MSHLGLVTLYVIRFPTPGNQQGCEVVITFNVMLTFNVINMRIVTIRCNIITFITKPYSVLDQLPE